MSCGCSPSSNTPPDSTAMSSTPPASNSYGGNTTIPASGACVSNTCPSPPVSDAEEIETYCPSWAAQLRTTWFGKLVIKSGTSCLNTLKSKCSGFIRYDASSGDVYVDGNPPFVSDAPQQTSWGFLAKVVNRQRTLCSDASDTCDTEGRQELAAQIVRPVQAGQLAIITRPACGSVPLAESADLAEQVAVNTLDPAERTGCEEALFLVRIEGTDPNAPKWQAMRRIKLPLSQIGQATASELTNAKQVIWIRNGGTDTNPCYELRVKDSGASNELPANASSCEIAVFDNGIWNARPRGLAGRNMASSPGWGHFTLGDVDWNVTTVGSTSVSLTDKPSATCINSKVWAVIEIYGLAAPGTSFSQTNAEVRINGTSYLPVFSGKLWDTRTIQLDVTSVTSLTFELARTVGNGGVAGWAKILRYEA